MAAADKKPTAFGLSMGKYPCSQGMIDAERRSPKLGFAIASKTVAASKISMSRVIATNSRRVASALAHDTETHISKIKISAPFQAQSAGCAPVRPHATPKATYQSTGLNPGRKICFIRRACPQNRQYAATQASGTMRVRIFSIGAPPSM